MTLLVEHADVVELCDYARMMAAIERGLAEEANGTLIMPARLNLPMRSGHFRLMPVVLNAAGLMGFKVFYRVPGYGARHLVALFEQERGELVALVDANYLTAARTGATSGIATKYLARPDAASVGVIGSGLEARTNLAAICAAVPSIRAVSAYSPNPQRRQLFADEFGALDGVTARACGTPEEAIAGTDIIIVATNTTAHGGATAFRGDWLEPGQHVVSGGSTMTALREVDPETFARADRIVVDAPGQASEESGDVITAIAAGTYPTNDIIGLMDLVTKPQLGRHSDSEITLYKSVGTALQDVMGAYMVWQSAIEAERGREIGDLVSVRPL